MEGIIRRIRRQNKRVSWGTDASYAVQVPNEWAERMAAEGYTQVHVQEWRPGSRELMVTPLRDSDVAAWRLEQRRERNRRRYAQSRSSGR